MMETTAMENGEKNEYLDQIGQFVLNSSLILVPTPEHTHIIPRY